MTNAFLFGQRAKEAATASKLATDPVEKARLCRLADTLVRLQVRAAAHSLRRCYGDLPQFAEQAQTYPGGEWYYWLEMAQIEVDA